MQTVSEILTSLREAIQLKGLKTQDEVRLELRDQLVKLLKPAEGQLDINREKTTNHDDDWCQWSRQNNLNWEN